MSLFAILFFVCLGVVFFGGFALTVFSLESKKDEDRLDF